MFSARNMKTWKVCQGFMHSLQTAQSQAVDGVGVINSQQVQCTTRSEHTPNCIWRLWSRITGTFQQNQYRIHEYSLNVWLLSLEWVSVCKIGFSCGSELVLYLTELWNWIPYTNFCNTTYAVKIFRNNLEESRLSEKLRTRKCKPIRKKHTINEINVFRCLQIVLNAF